MYNSVVDELYSTLNDNIKQYCKDNSLDENKIEINLSEDKLNVKMSFDLGKVHLFRIQEMVESFLDEARNNNIYILGDTDID